MQTKASINESDYIHTFDDVAFVLKIIAFPYGTSLHNQIKTWTKLRMIPCVDWVIR